ncbi:MAG: hypothetical protein ABGX07_17310, partial [Pirellulaceae bacterium]
SARPAVFRSSTYVFSSPESTKRAFAIALGKIRPQEDEEVELIGVEAGGRGVSIGDHAAPLSHGAHGILHGSYSYVMQDEDGQTSDVHSVSAGLDYPGVGPEHSYWKDSGRATYTDCLDDDAMAGFEALVKNEGILPALETSHAIAKTIEIAAQRSSDEIILVCLSGRGDKDAAEIRRLRGDES